jgi:hypothetical protein
MKESVKTCWACEGKGFWWDFSKETQDAMQTATMDGQCVFPTEKVECLYCKEEA